MGWYGTAGLGRRADLVSAVTIGKQAVGGVARTSSEPTVASGGRGPISQMIIATTTNAMTNAMLVCRSIGLSRTA